MPSIDIRHTTRDIGRSASTESVLCVVCVVVLTTRNVVTVSSRVFVYRCNISRAASTGGCGIAFSMHAVAHSRPRGWDNEKLRSVKHLLKEYLNATATVNTPEAITLLVGFSTIQSAANEP